MKARSRFIHYLQPYRLRILWTIAAVLVMSLVNVTAIPVVQRLVEAIATTDFGTLLFWIVVVLGLYMLRAASAYIQIMFSLHMGHGLVSAMRVDVFRHLQVLSLDFYDRWRSGDILSRIMNDIQIVQVTLVEGFVRVLPHIFTPIGVIAYLLYMNWILTVLTIVLSSSLFFFYSRFRETMMKASKKVSRNNADIASFVQETLRGIKVIQSNVLEQPRLRELEKETDRNFRYSMEEARVIAIQEPLVGFFQIMFAAGVFGLGGYFVLSGRMKGSELAAFFIGLTLLIDPVRELSRLNVLLQRARASLERVFEILDLQSSVTECSEAVDISEFTGTVEFSNISFRYDRSHDRVLNGINLRVHPSEMVAVVGPSGAGKTTLVNLIPRFYDPEEGTVRIDGRDIRTITLPSLRSAVGYVPQETVLFSGTVRENIAMGRPAAPNGAIEQAARLAQAHEFILRLPRGYESPIGENGILLSEGERQRIAIARTFLKDPPILILDEITSSLDSESEELIRSSLSRLVRGRTTFIIAHRLSTIRHADRIIFLEGGRIRESGSHRQLMENRGSYRRFHEIQSEEKTA